MEKLLIAGFSAVLVIGFGAYSNQSAGSGGNLGGSRATLVVKVNSTEYWVEVKGGAKAAGKELGVDVSFNGSNAGSEGNKQLNQLQNAINDKPLGTGLAPQDDAQDGAPMLMDRVKESGVPVVILDTPLSGSDVPVTTVAFDNKGMGAQAAEELVVLTGDEGKVAIIVHGKVGIAAARRDGFKEYLIKNTPKLQVIDMQNGGSGPAKSHDKAQGILQAHPDLVGLFGTDDDLTITITGEVATKNLQTKMVDVDSSPDVTSLLEQGRVSGTVVQNPYGMGKKAVELIVVASEGGSPVGKNVVSESAWVTTENLEDPDAQQIVN